MSKQRQRSLEKALFKAEKGESKLERLKYLEAVECFKEAIRLLPNGYDKLLGGFLNNQGIALDELGRHEEAKLLYERVLIIREKISGKEHPSVASSLNNLAVLYFEQGNYIQAKPLHERALAIREKILGEEHPDVANSLNNLANLYCKQGDYTQAKLLYERALTTSEKILGKEHRDVAMILNNLAIICLEQGDYAQARPLYERALAIREKVLGKEHPEIAKNISNLALCYEQGDYIQAKLLYERALAIQEKVLGKEHPHVADVIGNLGELYYKQNDYIQAEQLYDQALAIYEKTIGTEHPNCASIFSNIATLYREQGKYAYAQELYEKALMILNKAFDSKHPDVNYVSKSLLELKKRIIELEKQKNEQQAELERHRRLSFLGEMATSVAHQINQPVGIIRAATSATLDDIKENLFQAETETKPLLDKIWHQTERLHKIINTFRRFARGDRAIRESVNINIVIQQTIELLAEQFKQRNIALILQLIEPAPITHANTFLLEEILINLLTNAHDALEKQPNATVWITSWQQPQEVGFQVIDNGQGISAAYRSHLFTPFHSTKATEHGTGLGLYICDKAIKELGGTIRYEDRPEGGACFIVALPQLTE